MRAATTQSGPGGERGHDPNRAGEAPLVGDQTREQRAGGEPGIAPQPVDIDRSGPPDRVGDVADRG